MKTLKVKDVDAYIAHSAKEAQPVLKQIREIIRSAVPKAEESISWNVPFYKYNGALAGFAVYKNHVSFGIAKGVLENKDRQALEKKGYATGSKTIQIRFDQKVPGSAIKNILKTKIKLNDKE